MGPRVLRLRRVCEIHAPVEQPQTPAGGVALPLPYTVYERPITL